MGELQHVQHEIVRHDRLHLGLILPDQRPHPLDDRARPPVVRHDVGENRVDLRLVDVVASQYALRRPRVGENRRERLVQLVRQGTRELAEQGHSPQVCELVPLYRDLVRRSLSLRDVADHHDDTRLAADFDCLGGEDRAQDRAVLVPHVELVLAHGAARPHQVGDSVSITLGRVHVKLIDRGPDGLVARIAEHCLPPIVQLENADVRLARDADRVEARAERRREPLLRRAQRRLDPSALVDLLSQRPVGAQKLHGPFRDAGLELRA